MNGHVLVTAAGSIVGQGIIKSLKLTNKYTITAGDASPLAAGLYRCDEGILLPCATSADYVDKIISVCNDKNIQAVFCGSDDELLILAESKKEIERKTKTNILIGSLEALSVARDKWATFEFCKANNLSCVPSSLPGELDSFAKEFGFPLVVKPREGYGSLHLYVVNNLEEANNAIRVIERAGWRPLLQKYIDGDEFTTGVTTDRNGRYVMSSISIKKLIKHGQTYKAFIEDYHSVRRSAEEVALKLGTCGPINVQAKIDGDSIMLFEINPRFSATCPMRAAAGVNEPDIVFRNEVLGEEIKIDGYNRLVCMRYWNEVYIPYQVYDKISRQGKMEKGAFILDYF